MIKTVQKYYNTLRYLKWKQFKYRAIGLVSKTRLRALSDLQIQKINDRTNVLTFKPSIASRNSYDGHSKFNFLNIEHSFNDSWDWNIDRYGKLWTYNLNYFEYLLQPDLTKPTGLRLIHNYILNEPIITDGMDPYPISLRVIFWIKFLLKYQIRDQQIDQSIYRQLSKLSERPEYHLMGNHLLENGVALLFGGIYIDESKFVKLATQILRNQLDEQILSDGGHFELSPMYHQIMLYRLLDSYNLIQNNTNEDVIPLGELIRQKCALMLGWIEQMEFSNETIPNLNDSTSGIAPDYTELREYVNRLGIEPEVSPLNASGYRKIKQGGLEVLIDVGQIGPDYIPGHAHSDTFNFILHAHGKPIIVDTGISTYEKNKRRTSERSTSAHNTVVVQDQEQSEVWGGFRVARRAVVSDLHETETEISASHNGYANIGVTHKRSFKYENSDIKIHDYLSEATKAVALFHFHPSVIVFLDGASIVGDFGTILIDYAEGITIEQYEWAEGFNKTQSAQVVKISFSQQLSTIIKIV